jgi:uncharacterized protein (TIGR02453 family)
MLQANTLHFLEELSHNNNRDWFDANRDTYQATKENFEAFVTDLKLAMTPLIPRLEEQQAKNMIFRIFRDVRFSKDKTPYKAHYSAYFSQGGRKWAGAGYYLHIQPGASFAAAGIWMPDGPLLKKIRQEIDYDYDTFRQILGAAAFKKHFTKLSGDALQKVPAGYDATNPAADYLKMKRFIAEMPINDEEILRKDFVKKATTVFTAAGPLVDFMNRAME